MEVTADPTFSTIPAQSEPGVYGSSGTLLYVPDLMYVSTGLTPADITRTKT